MTVLALDGPAGAGKSTVARTVARRLGWSYVDTGAMYRALAAAALDEGIDPSDGAALADLAARVEISATEDLVTLDGRDLTRRVRDPDVTGAVSVVSAHPQVREALVAMQREAAQRGNVVMEGRDIGTAVVPGAEVKIFMTASLDERARRRWNEMDDADRPPVDEIMTSIENRDLADTTRAASPLVEAEDAVVLDTTELELDEVVDAILSVVQRKLG